MVDSSATRLPFRVSQQAGGEEHEGAVMGAQASFLSAGSTGYRDAACLGLAGMWFFRSGAKFKPA